MGNFSSSNKSTQQILRQGYECFSIPSQLSIQKDKSLSYNQLSKHNGRQVLVSSDTRIKGQLYFKLNQNNSLDRQKQLQEYISRHSSSCLDYPIVKIYEISSNIQFEQCTCMLFQCLIGYYYLYMKYNLNCSELFEISDRMVGVNQVGKVKVWLSQNMADNRVKSEKPVLYITKPLGQEDRQKQHQNNIKCQGRIIQQIFALINEKYYHPNTPSLTYKQQILSKLSIYLQKNNRSPNSFIHLLHSLAQFQQDNLQKIYIPNKIILKQSNQSNKNIQNHTTQQRKHFHRQTFSVRLQKARQQYDQSIRKQQQLQKQISRIQQLQQAQSRLTVESYQTGKNGNSMVKLLGVNSNNTLNMLSNNNNSKVRFITTTQNETMNSYQSRMNLNQYQYGYINANNNNNNNNSNINNIINNMHLENQQYNTFKKYASSYNINQKQQENNIATSAYVYTSPNVKYNPNNNNISHINGAYLNTINYNNNNNRNVILSQTNKYSDDYETNYSRSINGGFYSQGKSTYREGNTNNNINNYNVNNNKNSYSPGDNNELLMVESEIKYEEKRLSNYTNNNNNNNNNNNHNNNNHNNNNNNNSNDNNNNNNNNNSNDNNNNNNNNTKKFLFNNFHRISQELHQSDRPSYQKMNQSKNM